jgi:uncharacterized membrane protein YccC
MSSSSSPGNLAAVIQMTIIVVMSSPIRLVCTKREPSRLAGQREAPADRNRAMPKNSTHTMGPVNRDSVEQSARSAIAAVLSFTVARLLRLPEAYWASITALVVMQSSLGAALLVSGERFAGTALGAAMGALLASYFGANLIAFGAGVFVLGLICAILRLDRAASRFGGITLAIVMLVARVRSPWVIALHRFIEVSVGITVALVLTAIWPGPQDGPATKPKTPPQAS